jgi:hypothetical protein
MAAYLLSLGIEYNPRGLGFIPCGIYHVQGALYSVIAGTRKEEDRGAANLIESAKRLS